MDKSESSVSKQDLGNLIVLRESKSFRSFPQAPFNSWFISSPQPISCSHVFFTRRRPRIVTGRNSDKGSKTLATSERSCRFEFTSPSLKSLKENVSEST